MPRAWSVHSLLMERARTKSKRGRRMDDFHLSLVIECGGMRGVAAGGFLQVFADAMLLDSFDTFHGSSSGACVAAYCLAQQSEEGRKLYYDDLCNRRVVNPFRFLSQPFMVDTDYIVDEIFSHKRRLDTCRILSEQRVLNVVTTSVASGQPIVHSVFQTSAELLLALKATLRVPGPFEPGIEIGGRRHLDGGISAPVPVFSAIASGATHILIVCTQRPQDYTVTYKMGMLEGLALRLLYNRKLQEAYLNAHASDRRRPPNEYQARITADVLVRPDYGTYCSWFTIDKRILRKVEEESAIAGRAYLRGDST